MMRRFYSIFMVMLMLAWGASARAALDLELTRGVVDAMPIAVLPFTSTSAPDAHLLSTVLRDDLQHSGYFRVLKQDAVSSKDTNMDWQKWRSLKLNAVVMGHFETMADGRYRVSFSLYNVFATATKQSSPSALLLQQSFISDRAGLRSLAHHIGDLIYRQLTGERGIFSTKIAYILVDQHKPEYTLAVADMDGHNEQVMLRSSEPVMSPTWRPDGRALAYVSFEQKRARIYEQDLLTGQRKVLSDATGINGAPAYSPDGQQLALVRSTTGYPKLYLMDLQRHHVRQLTTGWSIDTEPCWAPDGKGLYFTSNRGGQPQIYYVDLATDQSRRVSYEGRYNSTARITPDGTALVMLHRMTNVFGIALQSLENGAMMVLTQSYDSQSPALSPNGKMVLYAAHFAKRAVLAMVSTDGRVQLRLPARSLDVREPAWSPFLQSSYDQTT